MLYIFLCLLEFQAISLITSNSIEISCETSTQSTTYVEHFKSFTNEGMLQLQVLDGAILCHIVSFVFLALRR